MFGMYVVPSMYPLLAAAVLITFALGYMLSLESMSRWRAFSLAGIPTIFAIFVIGIAHLAIPVGYQSCSSIGPYAAWSPANEPWKGFIGRYVKIEPVTISEMEWAGDLVFSYESSDPGWVHLSGVDLKNGEWVATFFTYPQGGGSPLGKYERKLGEPLIIGNSRLVMVELGPIARARYRPAKFRFERI